MKFLLFAYILMANLQFYDANQIQLGKYFSCKEIHKIDDYLVQWWIGLVFTVFVWFFNFGWILTKFSKKENVLNELFFHKLCWKAKPIGPMNAKMAAGKNLKKLIVFGGAKNLTETMSIVLAESTFFRFRRTHLAFTFLILIQKSEVFLTCSWGLNYLYIKK